MKRSELIDLINEVITTRNIALKESIKDMLSSQTPLKESLGEMDFNNVSFDDEPRERTPRSMKKSPEMDQLLESMGKSKSSKSATPLFEAIEDIANDPNEKPIDE